MSNKLYVYQAPSSHPVPYQLSYKAMVNDVHLKKSGTTTTSNSSCDQLWLLEHNPVYTLGRHAKPEHILTQTDIDIIKSDRGGEVTYHGPGQLIGYYLCDLTQMNIGVKQFVQKIEQSIIDTLKIFNIQGHLIKNQPGVYINHQKIASIGLRVKRGITYHGISINHSMDLSPFSNINPCGCKGLVMTQIQDHNPQVTMDLLKSNLIKQTRHHLNYGHSKEYYGQDTLPWLR